MKPIDYYNENVNTTTERSFLFDRERKSKNIIMDYILAKDKDSIDSINLLDIGCGDGFFLHCLSKEFSGDLHGIDYSEYQLERAKKRSYNATFKRVNLEDGIPFEDCFFDIVYSGEVIEHLYNPDFFVGEVHRILKNDGVFVVSTPNLCSWVSRAIFPLGIYPIYYESSTKDSKFGFGFLKSIKKQSVPVGHIRVMNLDALQSLLSSNGFNIVHINGVVFEPFSGIIGFFDKLMTAMPTLSSGFVVCARKVV
jgi:2-polyprenyl-3-methyl-5-hydroxy-6-metoxy-1,4-benzoquinol methylase